jgi:hypothetical protein
MAKNVILTDICFKKIIRKFKEIDGSKITVGWHEDSGTDSQGVRNVDKALWTEFGKENRDGSRQPERPAARNAYTDSEGMLKSKIKRNILAITRGADVKSQLKITAGWYAQIMRGSVLKFSSPGNAPSTIAQKGFNDPWIWSYSTVNAIDFKVLM